MPTIDQLPQATSVNPTDETFLEQNGTLFSVAVDLLVGSAQPKLTLASGNLLGRVSTGPGGPEPVGVGAGLVLSGGQLISDPTVSAPLASPAFTGTPTAPTPPLGDSSDLLATTAFVQEHALSLTLPPATTFTLGGVKIGSGLSVAVDGTTSLNPSLPAVDASNATVTASIVGAQPRRLADIRGEEIHVADILGAKPTGQNASAAILTALSIAATMPGSTIILCQGQWNFSSLTTGLFVPTSTTIKGAGPGQTTITWNDTGAFNLFNCSGSSTARASNIHFEDFTVTGTWATNGNAIGTGGFPFLPFYVDTLSFRNVCSQYSRAMGIAARNCTDVIAENCTVRYAGRDGINFTECAAITISDCNVEHCDDDGIAAHSNISDPWLVRRNLVITNNRVFDAQGIKALAGRSFTITGNVIDCCRAQGIDLTTLAADGVSLEGETGTQVGTISGNVIVNIISRTNIDNLNESNPGIVISGTTARAGSLGTIPGEANTSAGTVVDPYPYFDVDSNQASQATPGSFGIVISGNFIGRTLPACNGTSINPVTGTPYNSWSDYGFGLMFVRSGWVNPQLAESDIRSDAISLGGGVVRDVLITGNIIRGMVSGMALYDAATRLDNIVFRGNTVVDCLSYGVLVDTAAALRVYIEDNLFDLDPYFKHPNRGSNGTWLALSDPTGVKATLGSGAFVRRNTFRNLCRDSDKASDTLAAGWLFDDNIIEADPVTTGFSTANKGVGYLRSGGGTLLCQTDSDPASATFGRILTSPTTAAIAQPIVGKWVIGHHVRNSTPALAGGLVNLGWTRLTTGATNNAGSDWVQGLAVAGPVSASLVLAGPATGSAVPSFRQLTAADVTGVANPPAAGIVASTGSAFTTATLGSGLSFSGGVLSASAPGSNVSNTYTASGAIAVTDNIALVNAASPVAMTLAAGAADGHLLIVKRFGAGAVTLTATIDGGAGTQVLLDSASIHEAVTLAWNAGNATWLIL